MFYPPQDDLRVAMKNITDSLKEKSLPSPSLRISQDGDFFLVSLDNVIGRHNITFFSHYYVSNFKCCLEFCVPIYFSSSQSLNYRICAILFGVCFSNLSLFCFEFTHIIQPRISFVRKHSNQIM